MARGLAEFTELLKNCKIKSEDEITKDTDWRISEWGYDDPTRRAAFLNGPTLEELTKKLREEGGEQVLLSGLSLVGRPWRMFHVAACG